MSGGGEDPQHVSLQRIFYAPKQMTSSIYTCIGRKKLKCLKVAIFKPLKPERIFKLKILDCFSPTCMQQM